MSVEVVRKAFTAPKDIEFREKDAMEDGWEEQAGRNSQGKLVWCAATAVAIFDRHPSWRGVLKRDVFRQRDMLYRPIPGFETEGEFEPREVIDADFVRAQVWCNRNGFPDAKKNTVVDAFQAVAIKNEIDPLRDYLEGLVWDGRPRLSAWLATYLGVEESEYSSEVGRRWMISAVARALAPGEKAEGCLILEGRQGGGKSTALRILAGADYFGDALPDLSSKDAALYVRDKWVIEIAELARLMKTNPEDTKAFISRQEERYRPAYGRQEVTEKRRGVFAGTTNRDDYLKDPTGNRRYWPVKTSVIDVDRLARDRDQLWAEAVHAYKSGETWWLEGRALEVASIEQSERGEDDPWVSLILTFCEGKEMVCSKTVLIEAIGLSADRMSRSNSLRVANILRSLGYQRDGQFTSGERKGQARFVRNFGSDRLEQ